MYGVQAQLCGGERTRSQASHKPLSKATGARALTMRFRGIFFFNNRQNSLFLVNLLIIKTDFFPQILFKTCHMLKFWYKTSAMDLKMAALLIKHSFSLFFHFILFCLSCGLFSHVLSPCISTNCNGIPVAALSVDYFAFSHVFLSSYRLIFSVAYFTINMKWINKC